MNQMAMAFRQFMNNPGQYLARMGIPQGMNNPQDVIQHLMDTGRLSQEKYNQLQQTARNIQSMLK